MDFLENEEGEEAESADNIEIISGHASASWATSHKVLRHADT